MTSHRERILDFLGRFPGRDDDELAAALKIAPRQTVNMVCRKLCQEGFLRRQRGPRGKLVNFLVYQASLSSPAVAEPKTAAAPSQGLTEDQVKTFLANMLKQAGWSVQVAWGRARGIDITAIRGDERWIFECKGTGSSAPMQNNYFLGAIGELLQRMDNNRAKHSVAFPDVPKFRRLWSELPTKVKHKLHLTVLFVTTDGSVQELAH